MREIDTGEPAAGAIRLEGGASASPGAADWLGLAATPTFAAMALLTAVSGGSDMLCADALGASPLSGMVSMYLLMSGFHFAPWLKLIASRRPAGREILVRTSPEIR